MENQTLKTLEEVLESFSNSIDEALKSTVAKFDGKILKGYLSVKYKSRKQKILNYIPLLNLIIDAYCELMTIDPSAELVKELLTTLINTPPTQINTELKKRYLKYRNISIPNLPIKVDKLAEVYDFSKEHEKLFNVIIEHRENALAYLDFEFAKFYNEKLKKFEFTDIHDSELLDEHTVYASIEEISDILCLEMLCQSLNNLKSSTYSFKELPEIDHTLLSKISIDKFGDSISVDIDKVNNPDGNHRFTSTSITRSLDHGFSIRMVKKE